MSNIVLAKNAGFCFGVKRAVDEAIKYQKEFNKRIYTLGPLIHNNDVVEYLKENNIFSVTEEELSNLNPGDVIVIRSHGVKESVIKSLEDRNLKVINATCPYVTKIQLKVKRYYEQGYKIIIVGDSNHPEVIGINGWCNDDAIITNGKDNNLDKIPNKVCVVSQTTEKKETWNRVMQRIIESSKEIVAFNTICAATDVRQKSASEISNECDVIIVVGGKNSSNTTKLYEICKKNCEFTYHIENSKEISEEILAHKGKNIGVTAGASTPDWIIEEVINILNN